VVVDIPIPVDGSMFRPSLAVTPRATVGVATNSDGSAAALVVNSPDGRSRALQKVPGGLFQGVTFAGGRLYWMLTTPKVNGRSDVALWSASLDGGPAAPVTSDVGLPLLPGSGQDIQVVAGRLYWTALAPGTGSADPPRGPTQVRSVALTGGAVEIRTVTGVWVISAWPWLVAPTDAGAPAGRYNLQTGTTEVVAVPPGYQRMTCGSTWCLASGDPGVEVLRPDGSDPHQIGGSDARPVTAAVTLVDRYVPMLISGDAGQRLMLYDLGTRQSALVARDVTDTATDGRYLWWATGDHETLSWHGVDVSALR
jgi:hypothetical protein